MQLLRLNINIASLFLFLFFSLVGLWKGDSSMKSSFVCLFFSPRFERMICFWSWLHKTTFRWENVNVTEVSMFYKLVWWPELVSWVQLEILACPQQGIFIFFYVLHKQKTLESLKFSTSKFWQIYMFWDVMNTISLFLQSVSLPACRSVCVWHKFCGRANTKTDGRICMKFFI